MNSTRKKSLPLNNDVISSISNTAETFEQIKPLRNPNQQDVGPKPILMICPSCQYRIRTIVRYRSKAETHIVCMLLSFTLFCCWLPYCMKTCRDAIHHCPNCKAFIGTYSA